LLVPQLLIANTPSKRIKIRCNDICFEDLFLNKEIRRLKICGLSARFVSFLLSAKLKFYWKGRIHFLLKSCCNPISNWPATNIQYSHKNLLSLVKLADLKNLQE